MKRERTTGFASGMNDSAASADDFSYDNECALILNGRVNFQGAAEAVGGSRVLQIGSLNSNYARGIIEFQPSTGARQIVRFHENGGGIHATYSTDGGINYTTIASGLSGGDFTFATMSVGGTAYLLCANGSNTMYSWTGAAWATVAGPTTGIKYITVFNSRLWATTGNSTVYASQIDSFTTWAAPDGVILPILTHDAENILNIAGAGSVLLVQKRSSTGYVDGFGNSDIIVAAGSRGLSQSIGCIAPRTFCAVGNGYVWLSDRGLEFWAGAGEIVPIAKGVRKYFEGIAKNRITETTGTGSGPTLPCAVYWPLRNEYWIAWPSSAYIATNTDVLNDEGLIVNLTTGGVAKRVWNQPTNVTPRLNHPGAMCIAEISIVDDLSSYAHPVIQTQQGDTLLMEYGTTDMIPVGGSAGYAIDFRVRSRPYDFGEPVIRKWLRKVRLSMASTAGQAASVIVRADGTDGSTTSVTVPASVNNIPTAVIVRPSVRASQIQIEVRAAGGATVAGIEAEATLFKQATQ